MSLIKSAASSIVGGITDMGNTALQNRGNRDVARINEADDVMSTGFNQEMLKQLQESLSKVDKSTLEKLLSQSSTSTTGTTNTTGAEKSTQTTQRGNEQQQAALAEMVKSLGGGSGDAQFQAAMNRVLRSGMPAIANIGNSSGSFDSTTAAILQNDLAVKAAEAGLGAQQANNAQLLEALKLGQTGTETTIGDLQKQQQEQQAQQQLQQQQQERQSNETGTTATTNNTSQTSTQVNQEFNDVGKDSTMKPTTGPIAQILNGATTEQMAAPSVAPTPTPPGGVPNTGAVMGPQQNPLVAKADAGILSSIMSTASPVVGQMANPLLAAIGGPALQQPKPQVMPAATSAAPAPMSNAAVVANTPQSLGMAQPNPVAAVMPAIQPIPPAGVAPAPELGGTRQSGGAFKLLAGDTGPIMAPLPIMERERLI